MARSKKEKLDPKIASEIEIHLDNTLNLLERHIRRTLIIGGLMDPESADKLKDLLYKDVFKATNTALKKRMKDVAIKL